MRSLFLVLIYIFYRLWAQVHCAASKFRMAEHAVPDNSMRAVSHVPKFDGTNHREWNYEIDLCFQNLDIADVVLGLELCPDEVNSHRNIFFYFSQTTLIPEHMVAHRSHMHLSCMLLSCKCGPISHVRATTAYIAHAI